VARCTFVCLVLSVLWAGCARHEETAPVNGPSAALVLEPAEIDLGEVAINTEAPFRARLVNRGSEPVVIENVGSSCGCAEAKVEPRQLAPGESAEVWGRYRAALNPGPVSQQVLIQPAGREAIIVPVKGRVFRRLTWSPDPVVLRPSLMEGRSDRQRLTVANGSDVPVYLAALALAHPGVSVEVAPSAIPANSRGEVFVSAAPECLRRESVTLALETSHPQESRLELPVRIEPQEHVEASPEALHLGVVRKAELLGRNEVRVTLRGNALEKLTLRSVRATPYLELVGQPSAGSQPAEFRFAVVERFPGIDLSGTLSFCFARGKDCVSFDVPVTGFLLQSR